MNATPQTLGEICARFRDAMRAQGIETDDAIEADGRKYRFRVRGDKPGTKNGAYALFPDGIPAGWFGTHRGGWVAHTWTLEVPAHDPNDPQAAAQREAQRKRVEEMRKARAAEEAAARARARKRAVAIWKAAVTADSHPYLTRKGVKPQYLREASPDKRARITHRTGWHGEGAGVGVFVLPGACFGAADEDWIFESDAPAAGFKDRGTLAEWQTQVAARCRGNSRMLFAVSLRRATVAIRRDRGERRLPFLHERE